jgi:hypothetical protein
MPDIQPIGTKEDILHMVCKWRGSPTLGIRCPDWSLRVAPHRRGKDLQCIHTDERRDLSRGLPTWMFDESFPARYSLGNSASDTERVFSTSATLRLFEVHDNRSVFNRRRMALSLTGIPEWVSSLSLTLPPAALPNRPRARRPGVSFRQMGGRGRPRAATSIPVPLKNQSTKSIGCMIP